MYLQVLLLFKSDKIGTSKTSSSFFLPSIGDIFLHFLTWRPTENKRKSLKVREISQTYFTWVLRPKYYEWVIFSSISSIQELCASYWSLLGCNCCTYTAALSTDWRVDEQLWTQTVCSGPLCPNRRQWAACMLHRETRDTEKNYSLWYTNLSDRVNEALDSCHLNFCSLWKVFFSPSLLVTYI